MSKDSSSGEVVGDEKDYGRASEVVTPADDSRVAVWYASPVDGGWGGYQVRQHETGLTVGPVIPGKRMVQDAARILNELDDWCVSLGLDLISPELATRANHAEGNATGTPDAGEAEVDKNTCTKALCANCDAGKTISLPPDADGVVIRESCPNCTEEPNDGAAGPCKPDYKFLTSDETIDTLYKSEGALREAGRPDLAEAVEGVAVELSNIVDTNTQAEQLLRELEVAADTLTRSLAHIFPDNGRCSVDSKLLGVLSLKAAAATNYLNSKDGGEARDGDREWAKWDRTNNGPKHIVEDGGE